jgi:hypothetical protein
MKRILLLVFLQGGLAAGGGLFADVVTLKDGRQITGSVEAGNTQELHIKVGDQSQTVDVHEVQSIQFALPAQPAPSSPPKASAPPANPKGGRK